jgi:hypothetical protein
LEHICNITTEYIYIADMLFLQTNSGCIELDINFKIIGSNCSSKELNGRRKIGEKQQTGHGKKKFLAPFKGILIMGESIPRIAPPTSILDPLTVSFIMRTQIISRTCTGGEGGG